MFILVWCIQCFFVTVHISLCCEFIVHSVFIKLLDISNQSLKLPNLLLEFEVNFILLHASVNSQYITAKVHYRGQFYDKPNNVAYEKGFVLFH